MAEIAVVTGSAGLIGSESVRFFSKKNFKIIGIDNNMRKVFFGEDASTEENKKKLQEEIPQYIHYDTDIREKEEIEKIFKEYSDATKLIIHTAAQPSHDWAAQDPYADFSINAQGTLILLQTMRKYCPQAVFIFTSTNKVYGDTPNYLPLVELETRWEVDKSHKYYKHGIDETMSVDQTKHSLFGASKVAADILVQEYGRYFGMKTVCFRGGCLTGPGHKGTMLHGFLHYLMKCVVEGKQYTILGYKGKQVRDNIHSYDLVNAFYHFYQNPGCGEVYNIGGSRHSNCSMTEAISICEKIAGKKINSTYSEKSRIGDHVWWISDVSKFKSHYPGWNLTYNIEDILKDIYRVLHHA